MQNGFDPCFHHAKRNRTHMTWKTRLCKTFQSKFKCFHYQLGTLGGHINQLCVDRYLVAFEILPQNFLLGFGEKLD